MEIDESRMVTIKRRECSTGEEIVYSGNRVGIRRFKRGEKRGLVVGRIGKLKIDVRDRLWTWIWRREVGWFEEFVRIYMGRVSTGE